MKLMLRSSKEPNEHGSEKEKNKYKGQENLFDGSERFMESIAYTLGQWSVAILNVRVIPVV